MFSLGELRRGALEMAGSEGLFAAPEGDAFRVAAGKIDPGERVVVFDTGTGYKYVE